MNQHTTFEHDPDQLEEAAREIASDAYDAEAYRHDIANRNTRIDDWSDLTPFDEWFDNDRDYWLTKAAESYIPAGGAA